MLYEYVGNIHIHTTYSDGSGTVEEVIKAAQKSGLDFIGITDHYTLKGLFDNKEGWYGDVLALIGVELNRDHNHYLAFDIKRDIGDYTDDPQKTIDEVNAAGGFGFIAHPFEKGSRLFLNGKTFPWLNWNVSGFTGLSVWNYSSQWKAGINTTVRGLYAYYVNRNRHAGPCRDSLKKWDELTRKRRVVAIGCSDAHAVKLDIPVLKPVIFPYEYYFRTVNTHIILREPFKKDLSYDKKLVYSALKRGNCFIGFDLYADSRGFLFYGYNKDAQVIMGEEIARDSSSVTLEVLLPRRGEIRLIRDGKVIERIRGDGLQYKAVKQGTYRIEADLIKFADATKPWIISNPIYVK